MKAHVQTVFDVVFWPSKESNKMKPQKKFFFGGGKDKYWLNWNLTEEDKEPTQSWRVIYDKLVSELAGDFAPKKKKKKFWFFCPKWRDRNVSICRMGSCRTWWWQIPTGLRQETLSPFGQWSAAVGRDDGSSPWIHNPCFVEIQVSKGTRILWNIFDRGRDSTFPIIAIAFGRFLLF